MTPYARVNPRRITHSKILKEASGTTATDGPDNYEFVLRAELCTVEELELQRQALHDARAEQDQRHEAAAMRCTAM